MSDNVSSDTPGQGDDSAKNVVAASDDLRVEKNSEMSASDSVTKKKGKKIVRIVTFGDEYLDNTDKVNPDY